MVKWPNWQLKFCWFYNFQELPRHYCNLIFCSFGCFLTIRMGFWCLFCPDGCMLIPLQIKLAFCRWNTKNIFQGEWFTELLSLQKKHFLFIVGLVSTGLGGQKISLRYVMCLWQRSYLSHPIFRVKLLSIDIWPSFLVDPTWRFWSAFLRLH